MPRLPPSIPSPDTHPLQKEVRVQVLAAPAAPSKTKVYFRDLVFSNSYFRDNSRWCHCLPGVSLQSDTLKSPLRTKQADKSLKKEHLGELFHIPLVSYHVPQIANGEETQETESHVTSSDTGTA